MAKIHSVKISNFRGIKNFDETFYGEKVVCLVGRGESGKTTILEAISHTLSGRWGLSFYDTDFYNTNTENPIEVEVTLTNVPEELFSEFKFGLHIRVINPEDNSIVDGVEEGEDDWEKALTIKLEVDESLEPEWFVINERQDPKNISSKDRSLLGVFLIADSTDSHFSWNQGNPLYSLLRRKTKETDVQGKSLIAKAFREAKSSIDEYSFEIFSEAIEDIQKATSDLGLDVGEVTTAMDFKKIFVGHNSVSLHEDKKVPFRLKGKGSKRLISLGIQKVLASDDGVILIDEVEQGLEPDRAKNLVRALESGDVGQIFLSTHSQNVVEELEANHIYIVINDDGSVHCSNDGSEQVQKIYRACPEAIYAKKVIICEGKTEIGICRAIDKYRVGVGKDSLAKIGVVYSLGEGSGLVDKAKTVKELGLDTSLFCDSDDDNVNSEKETLTSLGVSVFDWEDDNKTEMQVFKDLPWDGVKELVQYRIDEKGLNSVNNQISQNEDNWSKKIDDLNSDSGRESLAKASTGSNNNWFKSIRAGEAMGNIIFNYLDQIEDGARLKQKLSQLMDWIDGNEQ
jgi:AAA15 family ATPase/GTPase